MADSSALPLPPPPSPHALSVRARERVVAAAAAADPLLAKLQRGLTATPAALDLNLMTTQYGLQFLSELLLRVRLLPHPAAAALSSAIPTRLRTFASLISDIRTFNRLWGTLALLRWGVATLEHPPADCVLRAIATCQVLANLCFQPMENAAYLGGHSVLPLSKRTVGKLWTYSSRLWAVHVILELVRLAREYGLARRAAKAKAVAVAAATANEKDITDMAVTDDTEAQSAVAARTLWARQLIVNAAYFPMTIHWSLESAPLLSDLAIGLLGTIAGGTRLIPLWRSA
ncbi:uncharacterized protein V1518DRAFT_413761 [Limtongia smithiae]|uniref:uncharacterized protein n=1 Tax=Limtongia smithiae TaxID=1125753 RepID=UPI0034CD0A32